MVWPETRVLSQKKGNEMSRVEINQSAPDFTLADFNGNEIRLSDFRGTKNILLVFNRGFA
jgi:peroxiredoxin